MRNLALFVSCLAVLSMSACADVGDLQFNGGDASSSADGATYQIQSFALKMAEVPNPDDPALTVWIPQTCTPTDDPTCNAVGLYQRLACDPDSKCRFYTSSEKCVNSGILGKDKVCTVDTCIADSDCVNSNPDPGHLNASCIFTSESISGADGDMVGECFYAYPDCKIGEGTPCVAEGVMYGENNVYSCSAKLNLSMAQLEICDGVDNDCDGKADNGFNLGAKCDGSDLDMCMTGTLTCKSDMLGTECINEAQENVVDICDGMDNDCDGKTDEDYPTLGTACDGADNDLCKGGTFVCSADNSGVTCNEQGAGNVEICNGKDDTCDGVVDEGCDDDGDKYCDLSMAVTQGATCTPGDCNDSDKTVHPGATETCNNVDDNCEGSTDEGIGKGDDCSDGLGECLVAGKKVCANDGSVVCDAVKKDPAQAEVCNGKDDTCDGNTDEGCDDDADGFCDADMSMAEGASCKETDCNDANKDVYKGATEVCNGIDDNCDGVVDEGCDDDADGYCDSNMVVAAGAKCTAGDCKDDNNAVNPGAKDICNQVDDNCDGKMDIKADGSAACDLKCPLVKTVVAGQEVEIDMAVSGVENLIDTYQCGTASSPFKVKFSGKEVFLSPAAVSGSKFSVQIISGSGAIIARVQKSCAPDQGTSALTPLIKNGTCAAIGITSISGGVVGVDYIVLDAKADGKVKLKFTVTP